MCFEFLIFDYSYPLQIAPVNTMRSSKRSQVAMPLVGAVAFRMASKKSTKAAVICQAQNPQVRLFDTLPTSIIGWTNQTHCDG